MKILRHQAGLVPLYRQIEVPRGAGHRRWRIGPLHRFPVDCRMDVEVVARQQVQRGVVRQGKAKRLCIVGIAMNRGQLVGCGRLRRDARDRCRSHAPYHTSPGQQSQQKQRRG